jgi:hypothetical protein
VDNLIKEVYIFNWHTKYIDLWFHFTHHPMRTEPKARLSILIRLDKVVSNIYVLGAVRYQAH